MQSDLTLRQLAYFRALAETRHYRAAAAHMGISQPSLSQQILRLESALGVTLVEKGRRGVILTPAGHEVLAHARLIQDQAETLRTSLAEMRDGIAGTIRLGSTPTLGPYILPHVVQRLRRDHPMLKLVIRDAAPRVLQDELLDGRHDMILTQLPVQSPGLEVRRLFREPLKLIVAQDHPLAGQAEAVDTDLAGQDMLALSNTYLLHSQIQSLCDEVGTRMRQDYEGTSLDALRQMTALNMGISLLPALYVRSEVANGPGDVHVLRFRQDRFTRSIGLVWRRTSHQARAIARVADILRSVAQEEFAGLVVLE